jgi:hypothetical protein
MVDQMSPSSLLSLYIPVQEGVKIRHLDHQSLLTVRTIARGLVHTAAPHLHNHTIRPVVRQSVLRRPLKRLESYHLTPMKDLNGLPPRIIPVLSPSLDPQIYIHMETHSRRPRFHPWFHKLHFTRLHLHLSPRHGTLIVDGPTNNLRLSFTPLLIILGRTIPPQQCTTIHHRWDPMA